MAPTPREGPVRQACLSCRRLKAKCDGVKPVCAKCNRLGKECIYTKSMRGGARVPKNAVQIGQLLNALQGLVEYPNTLSRPSSGPDESTIAQHSTDIGLHEVVAAYYERLHTTFFLLPDERAAQSYLESLNPLTPLKPAIQAFIILLPSAVSPIDDKRSASAYFARQASDAIGEALAAGAPTLDLVQALYLLSIWEWAEGGKPSKSRTLAIQALQLGMEMGLHQMDSRTKPALIQTTWYNESARRTWWSCFALHTSLSVLASTSPMIELNDHRLHTAYPACDSMPDVWKNYVETVHRCAVISDQVAQLHSTQQWSVADFEALLRRLRQMDEDTQHVRFAMSSTALPDEDDHIAAHLDCVARLGLSTSIIHLHRQHAFSDFAVYSRDTCGLPKGPAVRTDSPVGDPLGLLGGNGPDPPEQDLFEGFINPDKLDLEGQGSSTLPAVLVDDKAQIALRHNELQMQAFPPVVSIQRCAAAGTEVGKCLDRMLERGPQGTVLSPICACGVATAVYADILFALFLCVEAPANADETLRQKISEISSFHRVLQDAGSVWSTVRAMADDVKGAFDALLQIVSSSRPGFA